MSLPIVYLQRCSRKACVIHRQHQIKYCYRCSSYCSSSNYGTSMIVYNSSNVMTSYHTQMLMQQRLLGDFSISTFHYCNPQHGVAYSPIDRRMRQDEVQDFMKSVKGWKYLCEQQQQHQQQQQQQHYLLESLFQNMQQSKFTSDQDNNNSKTENQSDCRAHSGCRLISVTNINNANSDGNTNNNINNNYNNNNNNGQIQSVKRINDEEGPPPAAQHFLAHDAIKRTFKFDTFNEAYLYFGRLFAFCYFEDKYPHVEWRNNKITIYLYSPKYKGLTRREARIAAFANDQYNMFRKDKKQQRKLKESLLGVTNIKTTDQADKYNNGIHNKVNKTKSSFANNIAKNCATCKADQNKCNAQMPKLKIAQVFAKFAPTQLQEHLHKQLHSQNVNENKTKVKLDDVGALFDFYKAFDQKK